AVLLVLVGRGRPAEGEVGQAQGERGGPGLGQQVASVHGGSLGGGARGGRTGTSGGNVGARGAGRQGGGPYATRGGVLQARSASEGVRWSLACFGLVAERAASGGYKPEAGRQGG